jgi:hypothetical protein
VATAAFACTVVLVPGLGKVGMACVPGMRLFKGKKVSLRVITDETLKICRNGYDFLLQILGLR